MDKISTSSESEVKRLEKEGYVVTSMSYFEPNGNAVPPFFSGKFVICLY